MVWQLGRHHMLIHQKPTLQIGDIVSVQHDWWPSWAILPHRTIGGKWVWLKPVYKRVVWRYTGFIDEPFTEYGDLLDVLKHNEQREHR